MNPQKAMGLSKHLFDARRHLEEALEDLEWYACNLSIGDPMESYMRGRIQSRIEDIEAMVEELDSTMPDGKDRARTEEEYR